MKKDIAKFRFAPDSWTHVSIHMRIPMTKSNCYTIKFKFPYGPVPRYGEIELGQSENNKFNLIIRVITIIICLWFSIWIQTENLIKTTLSIALVYSLNIFVCILYLPKLRKEHKRSSHDQRNHTHFHVKYENRLCDYSETNMCSGHPDQLNTQRATLCVNPVHIAPAIYF